MAETVEIKVPDIGDFDEVDVIEVLVKAGDTVEKEDSLITLESDKATMEVPAPFAGTIKDIKVGVGDKVSEGTVIATAEAAGEAAKQETPEEGADETPAQSEQPEAERAERPTPRSAGDAPSDADCDVVVIGAGPGGYTAAFRAADLGLKTVLVERYPDLGGVCLNVGCIPSKALLHAAALLNEADHFAENGIEFGKPKVHLEKLSAWKSKVVKRLTGGLGGLAKQRKVQVIQGKATFKGPFELSIEGDDGSKTLSFKHCIIAAGSRPAVPPGIDMDDPRMMDSTDALKLEEVPKRLLVIGGGIIGLEMATVYAALGSKITVVEMMDRLMVGADADLVKPLRKLIDKRYENIYLKTKVTEIKATKKQLTAHFEGGDAPAKAEFDRVLVSVGRRPNSDLLNLEAAGLKANDRGLHRGG